MASTGRAVLEIAGVLIALGGVYDLFIPRLPANLARRCAGNQAAATLVRELLRALGGALTAIGLTVFTLAATTGQPIRRLTLVLVVLLVVPAEGVNAFSMRRVASPFYVPLAFMLFTLLGVLLAWPHP